MIQVFLEMYKKSIIYLKNIEVFMTETFKFLNELPTPIMNYIFQNQENYYTLRNPRSVSKRKFTTTYGIDTICFR